METARFKYVCPECYAHYEAETVTCINCGVLVEPYNGHTETPPATHKE